MLSKTLPAYIKVIFEIYQNIIRQNKKKPKKMTSGKYIYSRRSSKIFFKNVLNVIFKKWQSYGTIKQKQS